MTIQEIINRPPTEPIDEAEMIEVVEFYIKVRKDRDVKINLMKNIPPNDMFMAQQYFNQLQLLISAYDHAVLWLKDNHKF
jgi:hypothetical protein